MAHVHAPAHAHGVLKVKVIKGVNLAIRDTHKKSSDPYVIFYTNEHHKTKTHTIHKNLNPQWNEEHTLAIDDHFQPLLKIEVLDHDTFSKDDKLGNAAVDLRLLINGAKFHKHVYPGGHEYLRIAATTENSFSTESVIRRVGTTFIQDVRLKLRDIECGELELQLTCLYN